MGCNKPNEVASPVLFPLDASKNKVFPSQDYQNQTMTAILRQLNQQNQLIARMQKETEKQRLKQQLIIDQMKLEKQKIQQEKRRLEKVIDKKPKIDIPDNYKNIGKGVLNKCRNLCRTCINTLPRFVDYQPGLKKCSCQGYGLRLYQNNTLYGFCDKCKYGLGDKIAELCEECYGYGVLNS